MARDLANLRIEDVTSVYDGKAGKCCCGCAGKHSYASAHREMAGKSRGYAVGDDEVNDGAIMRVFGTILEAGPKQDDPSDDYVYAELGDRIYIAYFRR